MSGLGEDASSQEIKNAAITTQLTLKSHQIEWLAFLKKEGRDVKNEELKLKKDSSSDRRLATAKQASLFDNTYVSLMRTELKDYSTALKNAYNGASNKQERAILSDQYNNVVLLLKQWPELNVGLLAD